MAGRGRSILALCLLCSPIIAVSPAYGSETVEYGYDARGRLVRVTRGGAVNAAYNYDNSDNRTNVIATGPNLSVSDASATEGSPLSFTVTGNTLGAAMNVSYATSNGSAAAGSDYNSVAGQYLATSPAASPPGD